MNAVTWRNQIVVNVGDLAASADRSAILVTHALGSCIGVTIYDRLHGVGGLLHAMLPRAEENCRVGAEAAMFVDTGVRALVDACVALGATRLTLVVTAAGGARMTARETHFRVGERNVVELRRTLVREGLLRSAVATDLGGDVHRTIRLVLATGDVFVSTGKETRAL